MSRISTTATGGSGVDGDGSLTLPLSLWISFIVSVSYVISIYSFTDPQLNKLDRNDIRVVKSRIKKITIYSVIVSLLLPFVLAELSHVSWTKIVSQIGLIPGLTTTGEFSIERLVTCSKDTFFGLVLISILFIGPLSDLVLSEGEIPIVSYIEEFQSLHGIRDLLVGPLTEELVYTSAIIVTLLQVSPAVPINTLIFLPPVFFSIAHFHHAYQLHLKGFGLVPILLTTCFQMTYTFLFGIFTNYVFLKTGSLWACFALHSFCNFMSVPKIKVKGKCWSFVYYFLLVGGALGFWKYMDWFTQSEGGFAIDW